MLTGRDRLEAATSRLEDIAQSAIELPQAVPALHQPSSAAPESSASTAAPPPPPAAPAAPAAPTATAPPPEPVPESIEEFDSLISQSVDKYAKLSDAIGGHVAEQAAKVVEAFREQRKLLLITTKAKKPDMSTFQDLLAPIGKLMTAIGNIKDSNRGSPLFDNLSTVSESAMVLAWVTVDTKPAKHVEESLASAQFFGNKILRAYKDK